MRRPVDQIIQIEIITLGLACVIGFFALIKGFFLLAIFSFYLIVISLICEAIMYWQFTQRLAAGKQLVRAIVIFLLTTYLLFRR